MRKIFGTLALAATLLLAACGSSNNESPAPKAQETRSEQAQPRTERRTAPARTIATPAPQPVTVVAIDACKDEIKSANGLSERSARRLAASTQYKTRGGMNVTVNADGIWGGCKVALEAKAAADARAVPMVTIARSQYDSLRTLAYVNPNARSPVTYKAMAQTAATEKVTLMDTNKDLSTWIVGLICLLIIAMGVIVWLGIKVTSQPRRTPAPQPAPVSGGH